MAGAPLGNQSAAKGNRWRTAIDSALENRSRVDQVNALEEIAMALLTLAKAGDLSAIKELGDRLDGRAKQEIDANIGLTGSIAAMIDMSGLSDDDIANLKASLGNAKFKDSPEAK